MTTCPGTAHALALLRDRPDVAFGVHLTLVRDRPADAWRPRSSARSLVDDDGLLPVHAQADAGLAPTHLDFHGLADGGRDDVLAVASDLAREQGLALRVWLPDATARRRSAGLPVLDHPFLDSFAVDVDTKAEQYASLLRSLPPGLSEWAVHPGSDDDPSHDATVRRGDLAFLTSDEAAAIVADEGIELIDYRRLQRFRG